VLPWRSAFDRLKVNKTHRPEIYPADANGASGKISTHPLTSSSSIIMPRTNKYNFKPEKSGIYVIMYQKMV
jgi:hypothetical protein